MPVCPVNRYKSPGAPDRQGDLARGLWGQAGGRRGDDPGKDSRAKRDILVPGSNIIKIYGQLARG
jgi:hypothetical protein